MKRNNKKRKERSLQRNKKEEYYCERGKWRNKKKNKLNKHEKRNFKNLVQGIYVNERKKERRNKKVLVRE